MKELEAMKAVYTYFLPEVRPFVAAVDALPKEKLYLTQTTRAEAESALASLKLPSSFKIPTTREGMLDLDMIHEPIIDQIVNAYQNVIPGLNQYKYRYPTDGSSIGIFHKLCELKTKKKKQQFYTLDGEYEGYQEYGKTLGINVLNIPDNERALKTLKPGYWFISNPSARDGNIIPNEKIIELCERGHKVILDLAYAGSTKEFSYDISHYNIPTVFLSFSKPYGLFRSRIGFTFSREPIDSLFANKWFKHVSSLLIALKVAQEIGPESLYSKYSPVQEAIVDGINQEFGIGMRSSDAFLLGNISGQDSANLTSDQLSLISQYKRGENYRFCLTPYFEKAEKGLL